MPDIECRLSGRSGQCSWYERGKKVTRSALEKRYGRRAVEDAKQAATAKPKRQAPVPAQARPQRQAPVPVPVQVRSQRPLPKVPKSPVPAQVRPQRQVQQPVQQDVVCQRRSPGSNCVWYYRGKRITLRELQKKVSKATIDAARQQRQAAPVPVVKVSPPKPKAPLPQPTEVEPKRPASEKQVQAVERFLETIESCRLPSGLTAAEVQNPNFISPYLEYYQLYMVNHYLPTFGAKNSCGGFSNFKLEAEYTNNNAVILTLPQKFNTVAEAAWAQYRQGKCQLFVPQFYINVDDILHAVSLVVDFKAEVIEFVEPTGAEWSTALFLELTKYKSQTVLKSFAVVPAILACVVGLSETECRFFGILYNWLRLLCSCSSMVIRNNLIRYKQKYRSMVSSFVCHMWNVVSKAGLLGRGAPLSLENTAKYLRQVIKLGEDSKQATGKERQQLVRQIQELQRQREENEMWALQLVLPKGEKPVAPLQSKTPYQPQPGDPPAPVSAKKSPVEFLNLLLAEGKKKCDWPREMTAEDRQDPYTQFFPYRAYYLRYMLQHELPKLGYTQGCVTKEELDIGLEMITGFHVVSAQPSIEEFEMQVRSLLSDPTCNLIVTRLGWNLPGVGAHAMSLVIDTRRRQIEYMEPNGPDTTWADNVSDFLRRYFSKGVVLKNFTFVPPLQACSARIQYEDYCAHYSLLYNWLRVACDSCSANTIASTFSKYSVDQNLKIINAFTCHMWKKMRDIGFLGNGMPLNAQNVKNHLHELIELKKSIDDETDPLTKMELMKEFSVKLRRIDERKKWADELVQRG